MLLVTAWRGGLIVAAHDLDVLLAQFTGLDDAAAQMAFALTGLVAVQVLLARLAALEHSAGRDAEALPRSLVRFHLRHGSLVLRRGGKKKKAPGHHQGAECSVSPCAHLGQKGDCSK